MKKKTTKEFINDAIVKHGGKYDYSLVDYNGNKTPVKIICPEHGIFEQTPNNHLRSGGCNKCGYEMMVIKSSKQSSDFIKQAEKLHKGFYDYSLVEYKKAHSKVKIICPEHGIFEQTPNSHLKRKGCPNCGKTGFKSKLPSFVYILLSECGCKMKVGITNHLESRINHLRRTTPFGFSYLTSKQMKGEKAIILEKFLLMCCSSLNLKGFHGCTEWVKYDQDVVNWLETINRKGP